MDISLPPPPPVRTPQRPAAGPSPHPLQVPKKKPKPSYMPHTRPPPNGRESYKTSRMPTNVLHDLHEGPDTVAMPWCHHCSRLLCQRPHTQDISGPRSLFCSETHSLSLSLISLSVGGLTKSSQLPQVAVLKPLSRQSLTGEQLAQ